MPWYTTNLSEKVPYYIARIGDCEDKLTWTIPWKQASVYKNDPQHRVMPADLELNPTALPKQTRNLMVYGRRMKTTSMDSGTCNGVRAPRYVTNLENFYPSEIQLVTADTPDWSLDMRLKIKSEAVNLGASLAEFRETAHMFKRGARGIFNAWQTYRKVRKGRYKPLRPCDVAAKHLMYDFGLRPLLGDVYDSYQALLNRLAMPIYKRFVVTKRTEKSLVTSSFSARHQRSHRAIVLVKLDPETWSGFTLGNFYEVAWEVVPFSVVVDWIFPLGDWLSSLDALKGTSGMIGTLSKKEKYAHTAFNTKTDYSTIRNGYWSSETYERSVITSIPIPPLPRYEPSKSKRNVLQGLSLLSVLNRGCK